MKQETKRRALYFFTCDKCGHKRTSRWYSRAKELICLKCRKNIVPENQLSLFEKDSANQMKVLSLFDGISTAQQALKELGIKNLEYYASEIDNYAIAITQKNHPNTFQLGDVKEITGIGEYDLLIGGSQCQDLSIAKRGRNGLEGNRSSLFFEYVRLLEKIKPKYFVLENVASMPKEAKDLITKTLGVEPIMINASLVSAQDRARLFWTNIPNVTVPEDKGIVLKDIIDLDAPRKYIKPKNVKYVPGGCKWDTSGKGYFSQQDRARSVLGKMTTVPTARTITKVNVLFEDKRIGVLNWNEIERLQSLPDNYTDLGDKNRIEKRGGVIGNGFNLEVIKHVLKNICSSKS